MSCAHSLSTIQIKLWLQTARLGKGWGRDRGRPSLIKTSLGDEGTGVGRVPTFEPGTTVGKMDSSRLEKRRVNSPFAFWV